MDTSGRRAEDISPDLRADVLARYPRIGLGEEFVGHFEGQAKRKPLSLRAKFVTSGWSRLTPWSAKPGAPPRVILSRLKSPGFTPRRKPTAAVQFTEPPFLCC